jgi:membrane associated rhomboid family serine protease
MLLADDVPLSRLRHAWVTWTLILLCLGVFLLQIAGALPEEALAVWPLLMREAPGNPGSWMRLLSYMFLHAGWLHLAGNLLVLLVFGDNVEDALGHGRFLLLYLAAGVVGGALHGLLVPEAGLPLVGASGAIAGVMAAYLLLYPRATLFVAAFGRWPTLVPASWFVAAWFAVNLVEALRGGHGGGSFEVAWWAHIGGFVTGLALVGPLRQPGVALFQPAPAVPLRSFGWLRRISFDFSPGTGPGQPDWHDRRLLALGKAALFILLLFFSAWF